MNSLRVFKAFFLALPIFGVTCAAVAETYIVDPGVDSLQVAYDAAANGDTLVLREGSYTMTSGSITFNKSLMLSAASSNETPILSMDLKFVDNALDVVDVTLQGLTISGRLTNGSVAIQGNSLTLLENHFIGTGYTGYINVRQFDNVVVIGNEFAQSAGVDVECRELCVFAGNQIATVLNFKNLNGGDLYIEGNVFVNTAESVLSGNAFVIGNRVYRNGGTSKNVFNVGSGTLLNNIFVFENLPGQYHTVLSAGSGIFKNNIVYMNLQPKSTLSEAPLIAGGDKVTVVSNIFVNSPVVPFDQAASSNAYNLCYNSLGNCGEHSLMADPSFVDFVDFALSTDSPAINAGVPGLASYDLDSSRNDMGAYGGAFPIDQFAKQLAPDFAGPYVYPLFSGGSAVTAGNVGISVITAAKLPKN